MHGVNRAAARAETWLKHARHAGEPDGLTALGLWLCRKARRPSAANGDRMASDPVVLPAPLTLVEMDRGALVSLTQSVTLADRAACCAQLRDPELWARTLGALALSYARDGDVAVVAALVRMSAHLELQGSWLQLALEYLLDQQQSDGSFGLLAPELALSDDAGCQPHVAHRLTVEVLWALAEVAAARYRQRTIAT